MAASKNELSSIKKQGKDSPSSIAVFSTSIVFNGKVPVKHYDSRVLMLVNLTPELLSRQMSAHFDDSTDFIMTKDYPIN